MSARAYDTIRSMVERLGGTMEYQRKGYRYGAWIIRIGGKEAVVEATGNRSFPELDGLHVPRHSNSRHWDDYWAELLPDAQERLMRMLR
jgi:hypothetical protein